MHNIQTIIISRTDNLGDVILTLPLAGFLKKEFPQAKILFIGKSYTAPIIQASKAIDEFLDREEVLKKPEALSAKDAIIFVFPDKELAKIAQKQKVKYRIGTSHRWFHWLHLNKLVSFSRKKSDLHESQLNFKLLKPLKLSSEIALEELPKFYHFEAEEKNEKIKKFLSRVGEKEKIIIFHPKSKGSAREWDLKNYFNLAKKLEDFPIKIFITGTAKEGELIKKELTELITLKNVINTTGEFSLKELITLIDQSDGLLACSTGPLHIASALGKYALGIYPPIRPMHPTRWKPVGENAHFLVLTKDCNDCRKSGLCHCIQSISVEEIFNHITKNIFTKP